MIFLEFPITGEFRFYLMILEWIFTIICFEISFLFLLRYKKEKSKLKYSHDRELILLFFTLSLRSYLTIIGSFFSSDLLIIELHQFISNLFLFIGFVVFIFIRENQGMYFYKKYFFSLIACFLLILFVLFQFTVDYLKIIEFVVFLSLIYLFIIVYYIEFIKKAKSESGLLAKIIIAIISFSFLLIGLSLTTEYSIDLPIQYRLIGVLLQLIGIVPLAFFFIKIPSLSDFDWKDKIEEVFIINKDGLSLFYKSYIEKYDNLDENLISSAITSVNIMLKEIMKSESREFCVIRKKGKVVYMFPSDLITGVIFSKKDSPVIEYFLKKFVIKLEQVYQSVLRSWDGDLEIFGPIKDIFAEIFLK